jgi:hypothetical protein
VNTAQGLFGVLLIAAISIVIFLALREFWCWYWKINRLVSLQEETNRLLRASLQVQGISEDAERLEFIQEEVVPPDTGLHFRYSPADAAPGEDEAAEPPTIECPHCGATTSSELFNCEVCGESLGA